MLGFYSVFLFLLFAADPNAPACSAVSASLPDQAYAENVLSLRHFDFKNQKYWLDGRLYRLKNGKFSQKRDDTKGSPDIEISLKQLYLSESEGNEEQFALVVLNDFSAAGSSSEDDNVLVFAIRDSKPVIVQRFDFDVQAKGAGVSFDSRTETLTITASCLDGVHHQPMHLEIATYRWAGRRFKRLSAKIVPAGPTGSNPH